MGRGKPSRGKIAGLKDRSASLVLKTNQTSMEGSSRESWSMGESLNQRRQRLKKAYVVKVGTRGGE